MEYITDKTVDTLFEQLLSHPLLVILFICLYFITGYILATYKEWQWQTLLLASTVGLVLMMTEFIAVGSFKPYEIGHFEGEGEVKIVKSDSSIRQQILIDDQTLTVNRDAISNLHLDQGDIIKVHTRKYRVKEDAERNIEKIIIEKGEIMKNKEEA